MRTRNIDRNSHPTAKTLFLYVYIGWVPKLAKIWDISYIDAPVRHDRMLVIMNSVRPVLFALVPAVMLMTVSFADASWVINFANNDQLEGDTIDDVATFTDGGGQVLSLTTTMINQSTSTDNVLNPNSNRLGINSVGSSDDGAEFDNTESWTFTLDRAVTFASINFGGGSAFSSGEFFSIFVNGIQQNSFQGMAGGDPEMFEPLISLAANDAVRIAYSGGNGSDINQIVFTPEPKFFGSFCTTACSGVLRQYATSKTSCIDLAELQFKITNSPFCCDLSRLRFLKLESQFNWGNCLVTGNPSCLSLP